MIQKMLRRIVLAGALLATATATTPAREVLVPNAAAETSVAAVNGNGSWLSMLGCTGCVIGAAAIAFGGPGAILIAVNAPGGLAAAATCVGACYAAFN